MAEPRINLTGKANYIISAHGAMDGNAVVQMPETINMVIYSNVGGNLYKRVNELSDICNGTFQSQRMMWRNSSKLTAIADGQPELFLPRGGRFMGIPLFTRPK